MSAICGLWHPSGQDAAQHEVDRMLQRLEHRGPDGIRTWRRGSVGLGHALLHTTPESLSESLPLCDATTGLTITADAWLANRHDLAHELGIRSDELASLCDSELILRAFVAFGDDCPRHLLGDFSFCICDQKKQRLFCARDVQGIKPFYYHHSPESDLFCFATEIKSLFALPQVPSDIAELRMAEALVGLIEDRSGTGFRAVRALPSSHAMWVERQGIRIWRYWHWDPEQELRLASQQEYDEAFRSELTRAVQACGRSAFGLGAFLSGGLDSSSIVCLQDQLGREAPQRDKLHTFSALFAGLPEKFRRLADENEFIHAVLEITDTTWHPIQIHLKTPFDQIQRMFWHVEDLPLGPNLYLHWAIYQEASRSGLRVMLDGIDGDTTVSHGLERLQELWRQRRLWALGREVSALADHYGVSAMPLLWSQVLRPVVPDRLIGTWRRVKGLDVPIWGAKRLIRPEFADSSGLTESLVELREQHAQAKHSARRDHMSSIEAPVYQALFHMADKAAGASRIESRYPFFDRDLLKFCLSLPAEQKLRDGWPRAILRSAMAGILPDAVAKRSTKGNLGANFMYHLYTSKRDQIERWTGEDGKLLEPFVDLDRYREMLSLFRLQPLHHQEEAEQLFWATMLGMWLERMQRDPRFDETPPA